MANFPENTATVRAEGVTYPVVVPHWQTDYIQGLLMSSGEPYEHDMLQAMASVLRADSLVLDVGANIGNHSLYLANVVGCRVKSFEPNSTLTDALEQSAKLGGIQDRLEVNNIGVGREPGRGQFAVLNPTNLGSQSISVDSEVGDFRIDTLDLLGIAEKVTAIKVDVEGMEIDVLLGGEALIMRDKPVLFIECQDEESFDPIADWMAGHGYVYQATYNATPTHQFSYLPDAPRELIEALNSSVRQRYASGRTELTLRRELSKANLELHKATEHKGQTRFDASTDLGSDFALSSATTALTLVRSEAQDYQGQIKELKGLLSEHKAELKKIKSGRPMRIAGLARATSFTFHDLVRFPVRLWRILRNHPKGRVDFSQLATTTSESKANDTTSKALQSGLFSTQAQTIAFDENRLASAAAIASRSAAQFTERLGSRERLKIAAIVDEFTRRCLADECDLTDLHPQSYISELDESQPDLLFVESAWRGHENSWFNTVSRFPDELANIIKRCRDRGIPTVFWCKEDPVHFHAFLNTAREFDFVLTTDSDCVPRYQDALGHDRVFFMPFAAQPTLHNPIETGEPRKPGMAFAGAYYTRFTERMRDLESLLDGASSVMPVDIYDRNFGTTRPNHTFPSKYSSFIVGTLHPSQIDIAYKGYDFALNLNSVKNSQSMFARRAYELLACGTVTLSNYARGLKVMLGDLVPMTDSAEHAAALLSNLQNDREFYDKIRTSGIRKVHHEHTFGERLRYLTSRIAGTQYALDTKTVTVFAPVVDAAAYEYVRLTLERQIGVEIEFVAVSDSAEVIALAEAAGVRHISPASPELLHGMTAAESVACTVMDPNDWHGDHYLLDLLLATSYCDATVIGRSAHATYSATVEWPESTTAFTTTTGLTSRNAIVRTAALTYVSITDFLNRSGELLADLTQFTIDRFDYCENGAQARAEDRARVSSSLDIDHGVDISRFLADIDALKPPALTRRVIAPAVYNAKPVRGAKTNAASVAGGVRVASALEQGSGKSIWLSPTVPIDAVTVNGQLQLALDTSRDAIVRPTLRYLDANGKALGKPIFPANVVATSTPPAGAVTCNFGLRFNNTGTAIVHAWSLGDEHIQALVPASGRRTLIVSTHYPSYEHKYRFGFLHSRVKSYLDSGLVPDVFLLNPRSPAGFAEYEGVETRTGPAQDFQAQVESGNYDTIAVHFMNAEIWTALQPFVDTHRIVVWIHGAEIQAWTRRAFNYSTEAEIEKAQRASDARLSLWNTILDNPPRIFTIVPVSQTLLASSEQDLDRSINAEQVQIVHNPIDTDLFSYQEKPIEQRLKILSIRPYSARTYANDLSVEAVLNLSHEPWFDQLHFRFVGDGPLFEETLAPIRHFSNVTIEKTFLSQSEIARLHAEYGVFLVPTRMDSQGVSRDEAMSSGLVPITTNVAAVPEFVDESEGYLAPEEDSGALADAIRDLYAHPEVFAAKSKAAAERVRRQADARLTIPQEIELLRPQI